MKKVLALVMALVLVLSLAACGGGNTTSTEETTSVKNDVASYLGKWKGDDAMYLTFNKGGVGRYDILNGGFDFTYEVKDEVVKVDINTSEQDFFAVLELNDDCTVLTFIQNALPSSIAGVTKLKKVQ
ncbi:LptM family lipoprotein [Ruminococcus sp.]|uniref:LptM family lipoprotein n=1 Tax=Ruminococcus sp. TaxID=41978 RepID=UPI002E81929C|nr:hypothetical protein [Ruminococcus sp.]MEE3492176.1 hypothetical protein [Ruminococcus sp.]